MVGNPPKLTERIHITTDEMCRSLGDKKHINSSKM